MLYMADLLAQYLLLNGFPGIDAMNPDPTCRWK